LDIWIRKKEEEEEEEEEGRNICTCIYVWSVEAETYSILLFLLMGCIKNIFYVFVYVCFFMIFFVRV
jgi:hypothetical protein